MKHISLIHNKPSVCIMVQNYKLLNEKLLYLELVWDMSDK